MRFGSPHLLDVTLNLSILKAGNVLCATFFRYQGPGPGKSLGLQPPLEPLVCIVLNTMFLYSTKFASGKMKLYWHDFNVCGCSIIKYVIIGFKLHTYMLMSDKIIVITFHMAPKEGFPIMSDA